MLPAENGGHRVLLASVGSVAQPERAFILGGYHRTQGKSIRFIPPVPGIVNRCAVFLPVMGKAGVSRQLRPFQEIRLLQDQVDGTAGAVCPERTGLTAGNGTDGAFDNLNIFYQGRIHAIPHASREGHIADLNITAGKAADGVLVRRTGQKHVPTRIDGGTSSVFMFVRVAELTVSARRDLERMVITRSGISCTPSSAAAAFVSA